MSCLNPYYCGTGDADTLCDNCQAVAAAPLTATARMTGDWLPFPESILTALGWREGDEIGIEVIEGTVILTKLADGTRATVRAKMPPARSLKRSATGSAKP
jgi:hypothetical protein